MGPQAMREIIAQACEFNGSAPLEPEVAGSAGMQDGVPLLTAQENAEACAEGWSLFTHFGETVEVRLERIDCPEAGEGALLDDAAAWQRVWTRATPLHLKAIEILKASSPSEHARIEAYVCGLEILHAET